ncbi:MAG: UbiX family flavin prenyltransferase [Promethearchaeota archaeon]
MKLVVGITGASGSIYAFNLLKFLRDQTTTEVHLVISKPAEIVIKHETEMSKEELQKFATYSHEINDFLSPLASGSQQFDAMIILPCSMSSLAAIAQGYTTNLLLRAADICIKEKRTLILMPRELPFSPIHLENMLKLAKLGVHIVPAAPGFYHNPKNIEDLVNFVIGRILDLLKIPHKLFSRWSSTGTKRND